MNFFMPTHLYTGNNCIEEHQDELKSLGASCILVTERRAAEASGALEAVVGALKESDIAYVVWDGVTANPPIASCIDAGEVAQAAGASFVLGIGGGSSLDAAKAVAVFAANPGLDERGFYAMEWETNPLPIALVGTTAGTGSEVTKVSVLTDGVKRKHSIHDDRLYARVSFGDSRFTHTCPKSVTLSCGVDVLAHAVESYFSRKADDVSRAFAVRAVRMASAPLSSAASNGDLDATQREQLYDASILGGLAINTTGTCFPHNVGYYFTESFGVPHGFASAMFMPSMLDIVGAADASYADAFFTEVGMGKDELVRLVESCLPAYDFGLTEQQIDEVLPRWQNNGSVKNTRADVNVSMIRDVLVRMFVL